MTTKALFPLLDKLADCRRAAEVSSVAMDAVRVTFASRIGAALLFDDSIAPIERTFFGCREADVEEYHEHWRAQERVFPAVMARAAPVHNWQVYREEEWRKDVVWTGYGRRLGIYHYMAAPIFGSRGRLIGVLNFCRRQEDAPFDETTLAMASAFSGFVSATLSRVASAPDVIDDSVHDRLAPRELQVARLVAAGRNNVEIALELGLARETVKQALRRVYGKLQVSGRAQMAATLAARGLLGHRSGAP